MFTCVHPVKTMHEHHSDTLVKGHADGASLRTCMQRAAEKEGSKSGATLEPGAATPPAHQNFVAQPVQYSLKAMLSVLTACSKLQEKGAGREPRWSQVLLRPLFTNPHDAASATLQHLVRLSYFFILFEKFNWFCSYSSQSGRLLGMKRNSETEPEGCNAA